MDAQWIIDSLKLYGLPGLLIFGFLKGWVVAQPTYQREVARADAYEALAKSALSLNSQMARIVNPPQS